MSRCVGRPLSSAYTNTYLPHIAVDPVTADVWVTHTRQSASDAPTRVAVEYGRFLCGGPGSQNIEFSTLFTAPDPCQGCFNNDNWLPAIAMHRQNGAPRVGLYWYGTDDLANSRAKLFTAYQENLGNVQGPFALTSSAFPVQSGTSNWPVDGQSNLYVDPWDFQTLGTSWTNSSFLSVWASDPRAAAVPAWNGGFETGSFTANGPTGTDWTGSGTVAVVLPLAARTGSYGVLLGNAIPTSDSSISQTFTAPAGAQRLSFFYKMTCPDTVTYDWLTATLKDNTVPDPPVTFLPLTCQTNASWVQSPAVDVIPGRSYTLTITNHDDNYWADPSYSFIDDVVFNGAAARADMKIMSNLAR